MTENDEQEHKHVEDDCKRADIKTLHVLASNQSNKFHAKHLQGLADGFCVMSEFDSLSLQKNMVSLFSAQPKN